MRENGLSVRLMAGVCARYSMVLEEGVERRVVETI